jgi:DivIVA domain-containing protein
MHNVAFISPPPGQPAYDEDEVDAFIDRVKATLAGRDTLTAQDVLSVRFNPPKPGSRGYHEAGVSAFLVLVATSLKQLAGRTDISNTPPIRGSDPSLPQLTPEVIRNVTLHRPPLGERGYVEEEVDAFLDRVEATLRGADTLTAQDVHEVRFHELPPDRGGYDQNEVEALLDLVEERLGNEVYRRWHA